MVTRLKLQGTTPACFCFLRLSARGEERYADDESALEQVHVNALEMLQPTGAFSESSRRL